MSRVHAHQCILGIQRNGMPKLGGGIWHVRGRRNNLIPLVDLVAKRHDAKSIITQKARAGFCPRCVQAKRIAVPTSLKLDEYCPLTDSGMHLWAKEGPWVSRRLAAVSHVMGENGSPLCGGWDWAPRSLEFVPPSPLARSNPRGAPVPIPTIAEAGNLRGTQDAEKERNIVTQDTRETMEDHPIRTETIAGHNPLNLDTLIPQAAARVRRDKHTRGPVHSPPKGNPNATSDSGSNQSNLWIAKRKGKKETPQEPHRGGRRSNPWHDARSAARGKQLPDTQTSWTARRKDWNE